MEGALEHKLISRIVPVEVEGEHHYHPIIINHWGDILDRGLSQSRVMHLSRTQVCHWLL